MENSKNSVIPVSFEYEHDYLDFEHFTVRDIAGGRDIYWPLAGEKIHLPSFKYYPSIEAIRRSNVGTFTPRPTAGFSLGKYHEFVVSSLPHHIGINIGSVEATFGEATPLIAILLEEWRTKWDGEWSEISTVRILGASHDDYELALLNALARYHENTGFWPQPVMLGEPDWEEEIELESGSVVSSYPMWSNIDALRFLHYGNLQQDDVAACINFYKVIEHVAFLSHSNSVSKLRHDQNLSDSEFMKRMLDLISKDEKGPIIRLIKELSDQNIVAQAIDKKLIDAEDPQRLAEALYAFRNSIVHGKHSYGYELDSQPIFADENRSTLWRPILLSLAQLSLRRHGRQMV